MILSVQCTQCRKFTSIKSNAIDRGALAKKDGEEIMITCSLCLTKDKYHVNKLSAKEDPKFKMTALVSCLAALIFMFVFGSGYLLSSYNPYYVGMSWTVFLSPLVIYTYLMQGHRKSISQFNRFRI